MADKRIIELEERLTLSDGDYFATDNTNGTCKVNAKILLDRFSDDEDAIATKAAKVDLTNISITGSTNNTGSTIASGTYFYKNGTLVKAIASIANGATLTLNTNYEIVTAGGLNDLKQNLTVKPLTFSFVPGIASQLYGYKIGNICIISIRYWAYSGTASIGIEMDFCAIKDSDGNAVKAKNISVGSVFNDTTKKPWLLSIAQNSNAVILSSDTDAYAANQVIIGNLIFVCN